MTEESPRQAYYRQRSERLERELNELGRFIWNRRGKDLQEHMADILCHTQEMGWCIRCYEFHEGTDCPAVAEEW